MTPPPDSAALAGLLAEDARMRAFAAVVLGASTVEAVQEATGLERREGFYWRAGGTFDVTPGCTSPVADS